MLVGALGCDPHRAPPAPTGKSAVTSGTAGSGGSGTGTATLSAGSSATVTTGGGTGGVTEPSCAQPHCPEVLYGSRQATRRGIEVDDTDVFWCEVTLEEGNVVRAAPKNGAGPVRTLGRWYDFSTGRSLIVDEHHIYWMLPEDSGSLLRVDKDGNNPVSTPLPPGPINGRLQLGPLHDAGNAVIVATHGCKEIMRVPKDQRPLELWDLSPYPNGGGGLPVSRRMAASSTAPTWSTSIGSTPRPGRRPCS